MLLKQEKEIGLINNVPGNHTESDMLYVPRNLKTRPGAPETHLAYITDDEAEMLQQYKPGTPHEGPHNIPNFDTWGYDPNSGAGVTGGSTADGGGVWSGDQVVINLLQVDTQVLVNIL